MSKELDRALAEREKFLKMNPHLRAYQEEIDSILDKTPIAQRQEVLHQLMLERMMVMHQLLGSLLKEVLSDAGKQ